MSRVAEATVKYVTADYFRAFGYAATGGAVLDDAGERTGASQCILRALRRGIGSELCVAEEPPTSGRGGVAWHTQGSGKSLTILMLAGALIREPVMANPTIVMVTDRNDLDDQLFGTFAVGRALLRQEPIQADSREHLKALRTGRSAGPRWKARR